MKKEKNNIFLGQGILHWEKEERDTERYGLVKLYTLPDYNSPLVSFDAMFEGLFGELIAHVTYSRFSPSCGGDLICRLIAKSPKEGEKIILGQGRLFIENGNAIGVKPEDNRRKSWMDIMKLYNVYSQTVELFFRIKDYDYSESKIKKSYKKTNLSYRKYRQNPCHL